MRKGSEILVKIDKTEFPSIGIGTEGDRKIYVKNTFPGQVVKGRVKKKKADYAEVKALEVVERAEYEIEPNVLTLVFVEGAHHKTYLMINN